MKDIVERLRSLDDDDELRLTFSAGTAIDDAADEIERLREALEKIAAYGPGRFRPLADEVAIWKIATDALGDAQ